MLTWGFLCHMILVILLYTHNLNKRPTIKNSFWAGIVHKLAGFVCFFAYLWVRQSTKLSKWPRFAWLTNHGVRKWYGIFFSVFLTPCLLSSLRWKVIWRWCTSSAIRVISFSFPEEDLHRHRMIISSGDYQSYVVMITLFEGDAK